MISARGFRIVKVCLWMRYSYNCCHRLRIQIFIGTGVIIHLLACISMWRPNIQVSRVHLIYVDAINIVIYIIFFPFGSWNDLLKFSNILAPSKVFLRPKVCRSLTNASRYISVYCFLSKYCASGIYFDETFVFSFVSFRT